jgi:hypothetical protein
VRARQYNAAITGLIGIAPQDEIEGMIAAQLIATSWVKIGLEILSSPRLAFDRAASIRPLLPYGVEPTGHAWLHSRCWEAWHAARKREAAAALKAMGVGKPTGME